VVHAQPPSLPTGNMSYARSTLVTQQPQPKDIDVVDPPDDSISRIAFCPTAEFLAVASWNGEVKLPLRSI
jgi:mRNA export factor